MSEYGDNYGQCDVRYSELSVPAKGLYLATALVILAIALPFVLLRRLVRGRR